MILCEAIFILEACSILSPEKVQTLVLKVDKVTWRFYSEAIPLVSLALFVNYMSRMPSSPRAVRSGPIAGRLQNVLARSNDVPVTSDFETDDTDSQFESYYFDDDQAN